MSEKVTLDLNDLVKGGVQLATFQQTVAALDATPYKNKKVQIKGCAPTWAHLMIAGKLFPFVDELEFVLDDGKGGKPLPVFKK